jgi:hypothetical protein
MNKDLFVDGLNLQKRGWSVNKKNADRDKKDAERGGGSHGKMYPIPEKTPCLQSGARVSAISILKGCC